MRRRQSGKHTIVIKLQNAFLFLTNFFFDVTEEAFGSLARTSPVAGIRIRMLPEASA